MTGALNNIIWWLVGFGTEHILQCCHTSDHSRIPSCVCVHTCMHTWVCIRGWGQDHLHTACSWGPRTTKMESRMVVASVVWATHGYQMSNRKGQENGKWRCQIQVHLRDSVGLVLDHCNKVSHKNILVSQWINRLHYIIIDYTIIDYTIL